MPSRSAQRRFVARDMPSELQVSRADGSFLYDNRGRKYLDFVMGWCVSNLGWNNRAVARRTGPFTGPDYVYPGYSYRPWAELAELLARIAPGRLTRSFRATGGSEAVDIALQAAMMHTGRKGFVSLEGSYHGNSLAALSIGDRETRGKYPNLLSHCGTVSPPLDAAALDRVETRLKRRDVAAFIMEPVSINLGVLIPDPEFMTGLQQLCRRYGTLLIMDEVACGFGRTGRLLATEHFGIEPDLLCIGKAITNGVLGLGATIATEEVAASMEDGGTFYSTYGWHPRSTHVAIGTVRYFRSNEKRLMTHVAEMSDLFRDRLSGIRFKHQAALCIRGLAVGIDLEDEDYTDRLQARCRRAGLLTSSEESTLLLLPALTIDRATATRGLDILESCA